MPPLRISQFWSNELFAEDLGNFAEERGGAPPPWHSGQELQHPSCAHRSDTPVDVTGARIGLLVCRVFGSHFATARHGFVISSGLPVTIRLWRRRFTRTGDLHPARKDSYSCRSPK